MSGTEDFRILPGVNSYSSPTKCRYSCFPGFYGEGTNVYGLGLTCSRSQADKHRMQNLNLGILILALH